MMVSSMYSPPSGPSHHYAAAYRPGPLEPRFELSRDMDYSMPVSSISSSRLPRPFLGEASPKRARTTTSSASEETSSNNRPFLPSISNLLEIADGDRSRHENTSHNHRHAAQRFSPREQRPTPAYPALDVPSNHRAIASPAMSHRSDTSMDYAPSSATGPSSSPRRTALSISALSADPARQRASSASSDRYPAIQTSATPYSASSGPASPYQYSPSATSVSSAHSPADPSSCQSFYAQQSNHSASSAPHQLPSFSPSNPWPHQHHHHYINSSSQSSLSQSQERYVCSKCQKAFSRPSSLKIHSHSHTGEKPFVCPYSGCGKSFSVRSNMRRHERGCHSPPKLGRADLL